jgi:hypothetical protein
MRSLRLLYSGLAVGLVVLQWLSVAPAAPLDDLIAAARKEGTLDFYGPSTLKERYGTMIGIPRAVL